jgi:hypothetical protein
MPKGFLVGPRDLAALFYQACERAGHTPTDRNNFWISPGWEVRPQ